MNLRLSQFRSGVVALLVIYWAALFVGTHVPAPMTGMQSNDKLLHLVAYSGLAFLVVWVIAGTRPRLHSVIASVGLVVAYGAVDELLQLMIPGRHGDLWDWLADVAGAGLGLLLYFLVWHGIEQLRSFARGPVS